jgi:hypothetical protein
VLTTVNARVFLGQNLWRSVLVGILAGILLGGNGPAEGLTAVIALIFAPIIFGLTRRESRPFFIAAISCFLITVVQATTSLIARTDASGAHGVNSLLQGLKSSLALQLSLLSPSVFFAALLVGVCVGCVVLPRPKFSVRWVCQIWIMLMGAFAAISISEAFSYVSGWHHLPTVALFSIFSLMLGVALVSVCAQVRVPACGLSRGVVSVAIAVVCISIAGSLFAGPIFRAYRLQDARASAWDERSERSQIFGINLMETVPFVDFAGNRMLEDIGQGAASIRFGRPYEVGYMEWCFERLPVGF